MDCSFPKFKGRLGYCFPMPTAVRVIEIISFTSENFLGVSMFPTKLRLIIRLKRERHYQAESGDN